MERLGDDELSLVFNKIHNSEDRKSFSQVSKQFMRVASSRLIRLNNSLPGFLYDILPTSPNLKIFLCSKPLSNSHMNLIAQSCPKLRLLNLEVNNETSEFEVEFEFDDEGLCALANACSDLNHVIICNRIHVGDKGIHSLITSCRNLRLLDLGGCVNVTDESLKAIGESSNLVDLNLRGCYLITDLGLTYLANENMNNCLEYLDLGECNRISDSGVVALFSQLSNIKILDMSWLINLTNITLFVIATKCLKLTDICLKGCEGITGEGLRAFSHHPTLGGQKITII